MEILIGTFGFFLLLSLVALVKFHGNPLFVFTFLLCAASLVWLIRLQLEDSQSRPRRVKRRRRKAGRR